MEILSLNIRQGGGLRVKSILREIEQVAEGDVTIAIDRAMNGYFWIKY